VVRAGWLELLLALRLGVSPSDSDPERDRARASCMGFGFLSRHQLGQYRILLWQGCTMRALVLAANLLMGIQRVVARFEQLERFNGLPTSSLRFGQAWAVPNFPPSQTL
jgi:hypothetical protein